MSTKSQNNDLLKTPDETNQYIFVVESEDSLHISIRLYNIFSRRRIPVLDFQTSRLNGGERQRMLIIIEETKENVLKLQSQLLRQVEVITVNLFEPVSEKTGF
ncbi:hypothetical protein [Adhaeribacter radiodurans]|uniref:ACT domain-containing protein n=1 Tax=Adhaeribacter radiodurans TaxID=2745197 RepID=A0A7L7L3M4_9BACT|nr:hypothetical protein [Adhaeribacter radiodurans]QMU27383.1 hypothetical protein HUW48_04725 [Adhaeribacter radiodurans]